MQEMHSVLTHLSLDKMAAILADTIFKLVCLNENDRIPIQISLKFTIMGPIDNKPALVQVTAWRRIIQCVDMNGASDELTVWLVQNIHIIKMDEF